MIDEFGLPYFRSIAINESFTILEKALGDKESADQTPATRIKVVPTRDFMHRMAEKFKGRSIDLIPQNCRYLEQIQGGKIVVIEEPPQCRTVSLAIDVSYQYENLKSRGLVEEYGYKDYFKNNPMKRDGNTLYKFHLAFPYLVFIFRLTDKNEYGGGKVFFRKKPLLGLGEVLFKVPLYNINNEQNLCLGSDTREGDGTPPSINVACQKALNRFWNAAFNHDYTANVTAYTSVPIMNNFFDWEYHTRQNPLFIYNIDMVPNHQGKKLIDEIKYMRGESGENPAGRSIFTFQTLSQAFDIPVLSDHETKDPVYGDTTPLMENIAHGIIGKAPGQSADVGDRFKLKDVETVIESFLGPEGGYEPTHIKLFNTVTKESSVLKLSSALKTKLFEAIFEHRLIEKIVFNDIEISKADIVLLRKADGREFYKRIEYIRRGLDDNPEIKLGEEYLTPALFGRTFIKKVEIDKVTLRGTVLKSGDEFYFIKNIINELPLMSYDELICDGPTVTGSTIGMSFKLAKPSASITGQATAFISLTALNEHEKTVDAPVIGGTLLKKDEIITLPPIFRYFRNIYRTKYSTTAGSLSSKIRAVKNKYFLTQHGDPLQNGAISDIAVISKHLIDNDTLKISSYDVDLEYSVGEKVIVGNWENPDKLLIPKTITGFKTETQEKTNAVSISLVLSDKQGNLEVSPFITNDGKIATGRIRKIVSEMNGIKAGTKIIANDTSIYCFPKKDVNIIVGFLVDTVANEPLVLCSNGLTLWLSDLEHFTLIPFTSRKWKTLEHVHIVDQYNIKLQPGDVVKGNAGYGIDDFLVFKHHEAKTTLRAMLFSYFHSYAESVAISNNFRYGVSFDGIPNPRVSNADIEKYGYVTGFPNLFGGIIPNPISTQQYIADPRSIIK